ncbi:hypothetical protein pipiens_018033 [Culex pipiens pipiens]|uniref:Uncharacterized protein n=1 Tax=Culex pipiens pipiens TaxID=38569 RepID=A0ABD1CDR0_CULPP
MEPQAGTSRAGKRTTKADLIRRNIRIDGGGASCAIDEFSGCVYAQAKLDASAISWEGLKDIFDPISETLNTTINRHVLGINVQYKFRGKRVIRTLGMVEVSERQTAAVLKVKIMEILNQYGLTLDSDEEQATSLEHERNLTESLSEEFEENINLVRCSIHTQQLAVLDVIKKSDPTVKEITAIAKKCRALKYKPTFDQKAAKYPPVWCQTRWTGIYKMINSFAGQEAFFRDLGEQFPELGN